ncbi:MAG TPA: GFA family protein [Rhizomicrobium sp.]
MALSQTLTGGCFCGAVAYELSAKPMFVHCCHCTDCQTQTGGGFAINAIIEAEHVTLTKGKPVRVSMPTESGRPHYVYRCAKCQTALWSDYGRRKVMLFVRVSTLKRPHRVVPDVHIFTRSKLPWVRLAPGAKAFKVYYSTTKEWPAKALARRNAVLAKVK